MFKDQAFALVRRTKVASVEFGGPFTLPIQHFIWFAPWFAVSPIRRALEIGFITLWLSKRDRYRCAYTFHILATFHPTSEINNQPIYQRRKDSFIRQWLTYGMTCFSPDVGGQDVNLRLQFMPSVSSFFSIAQEFFLLQINAQENANISVRSREGLFQIKCFFL